MIVESMSVVPGGVWAGEEGERIWTRVARESLAEPWWKTVAVVGGSTPRRQGTNMMAPNFEGRFDV